MSTSSPEQRAKAWANFWPTGGCVPEDERRHAFVAGWNARDAEVEVLESRIAEVEKVLQKPFHLKQTFSGYTREDFSRPLVEANAIRAALSGMAVDAQADHE